MFIHNAVRFRDAASERCFMTNSAPTLHTVDIGGEAIEYALRFSPKAKRQRIKVSPAGVEVVLPVGVNTQTASTFIIQHQRWVLRHLARLRQSNALRNVQEANGLLLRGREMHVRVQVGAGDDSCDRVVTNDDVVTVIVTNAKGLSARRALTAWLQQQARRDIAVFVRERARQMQVRPNRLFIRDQRTRWGSCSSKRNVSFNWRLIFAPPEVLDYVVVHELAHLREMNHSPRFWAIVCEFCPDFERHKRWLNQNAFRLYAPISL